MKIECPECEGEGLVQEHFCCDQCDPWNTCERCDGEGWIESKDVESED